MVSAYITFTTFLFKKTPEGIENTVIIGKKKEFTITPLPWDNVIPKLELVKN
ncbi:MAG TPA: hypothetical protein VFV86_04000 [Nitrososphaeraceae archaeon]|nr:hypothetical protein [Nitrososphaeraceae archaeon]